MLTVVEIGEKIAVARKLQNLSQAGLADRMAVSAQAVGKWERGESMPDILTFARLAEELGVDLNYFGGIEQGATGANGHTRAAVATVEVPEEQVQKPGWNMSGGIWKDADFSGLSGLAERFSGANIERCKFIGAELSGLFMKGNNIRNSDFTHSDMSGSKFTGTNFDRDVFANCDFTGAEFVRSYMKSCDLTGAKLTGVLTRGSNFAKVSLAGAALEGSSFRMGQFTDMVFEGAITRCAFENFDFARVEFRDAVLRETFFKDCALKRVKFAGCMADKLTYAFMKACKADLTDVELLEE